MCRTESLFSEIFLDDIMSKILYLLAKAKQQSPCATGIYLLSGGCCLGAEGSTAPQRDGTAPWCCGVMDPDHAVP